MSAIREDLFSTYHSITIESMHEEYFFFAAEIEIPLKTFLFLEEPEEVLNGFKRFKKFEIVESQKTENGFRYYGVFEKRKFNFEEWEKTHRKKKTDETGV